MFEYAITKTKIVGGTLTGETTIFDADPKRCFLSIQILSGAAYCSIHNNAVEGRGIYLDTATPLQIEIPITGSVHLIPEGGTGAVIYTAAEGLT